MMSHIFTYRLCSGVYLCTPSVINEALLKLMNVRSIVSCTSSKSIPILPSVRYFTVYIEDNPDEDIQCFFDPVVSFIEERRKYGNIFIPCIGGPSRAGSVAVAFLVKALKMDFLQACQFVFYWTGVPTNLAFLVQLWEFSQAQKTEESFFIPSSVFPPTLGVEPHTKGIQIRRKASSSVKAETPAGFQDLLEELFGGVDSAVQKTHQRNTDRKLSTDLSSVQRAYLGYPPQHQNVAGATEGEEEDLMFAVHL